MTAAEIHKRMLANPADSKFLLRFFKTGPGEYAEGDRFLGIRVPATRRVAAACGEVALADLAALLRSKWHEERLLALRDARRSTSFT